jgi:hypothetical protein
LQAVDVQACAKALRCCMQMQDKARVYIGGAGLDLVFSAFFVTYGAGSNPGRLAESPRLFLLVSIQPIIDQYEATRRTCDS